MKETGRRVPPPRCSWPLTPSLAVHPCLLCTRGAYSVLSPSHPKVSHECSPSPRCTLSLPIFIPGLLFILALLAICSWPGGRRPLLRQRPELDSPALQLVLPCAGGRHVPDPAAGDRLQPLCSIRLGPDDAARSSASPPGSPCCSPPAWGWGSCISGWAGPPGHFVSPPRRRP